MLAPVTKGEELTPAFAGRGDHSRVLVGGGQEPLKDGDVGGQRAGGGIVVPASDDGRYGGRGFQRLSG